MDNYPENLAPEFEESGSVATPFEEWWARVRPHFPNVPEEVAREWLHRHWSHSPYEWLRSSLYDFTLLRWQSSELATIRSGWCDYEDGAKGCLEHGKYLSTIDFFVARFMMKEHRFPSPIIVLDNRVGHIRRDYPNVSRAQMTPDAFVLIEGHLRFNLGLYLDSTGGLATDVDVWMMTRNVQSSSSSASLA